MTTPSTRRVFPGSWCRSGVDGSADTINKSARRVSNQRAWARPGTRRRRWRIGIPAGPGERVYRWQRPDGSYEVWIADRPSHALIELGRIESALVYAALWLRRH